MKTAIVVPCYNEEKRLVSQAFIDFVASTNEIDFIFVNDGSKDRTTDLLQQICNKSNARASFFSLEKNSGKAEAVRQGLVKAMEGGYHFVGYWDADLSTPLSEIPLFLAYFSDTKIITVLGSRVKLLGKDIQRKVSRHYIGRVFATLASLLLKIPVYDTQCGAKIFRTSPQLKKVFQSTFQSRWIFDVEIIARMQRIFFPQDMTQIKYVLVEKPVNHWRDVGGSKLRSTDFLRAFFELWGLTSKYRLSGRSS